MAVERISGPARSATIARLGAKFTALTTPRNIIPAGSHPGGTKASAARQAPYRMEPPATITLLEYRLPSFPNG